MVITLLNSSILTAFGTFEYEALSLARAKELVRKSEIQSAIGHQSTADILSTLLETKVALNRLNYVQEIGDQAIVFKLRSRPAEGAILTRDELEKIGYDFGLIRRVK